MSSQVFDHHHRECNTKLIFQAVSLIEMTKAWATDDCVFPKFSNLGCVCSYGNAPVVVGIWTMTAGSVSTIFFFFLRLSLLFSWHKHFLPSPRLANYPHGHTEPCLALAWKCSWWFQVGMSVSTKSSDWSSFKRPNDQIIDYLLTLIMQMCEWHSKHKHFNQQQMLHCK